MAIDLFPLYEHIAANAILADSISSLLDGLVEVLDTNQSVDLADALRELVAHPDDQNRKIAMGRLLAEALTRNTSHIAVRLEDPLIPHVQKALELPFTDRAAHVAALQYATSEKVLDVAAKLAEVQAEQAAMTDDCAKMKLDCAALADALDKKTSEAARLGQLHAAINAQLATSEAVVTAQGQQIVALQAQTAAQDATIKARDAQLAAVKP